MTWVVGTPTMFGYGFGLSDVRVTLADGREIDCLQKIYGIGRYVAAGFAGDVEIGFAMIEALRKAANLPDDRQSCDPLSIEKMWPEMARQVFAQFPDGNRNGQCHLMLISAHPKEHNGNPAWARSYVHIFKSPDFSPAGVKVHTLGSIGCGDSFAPCRQEIDNFSNDHKRRENFTQGEVGTPGGMGTMLGFNLTQLLMRTQPGGVSSHLHYCWVYRGQIIIKTNDHRQKGRWSIVEHGSGVNVGPSVEDAGSGPGDPHAMHFEMPPIATSWDELNKVIALQGSTAVGCRA